MRKFIIAAALIFGVAIAASAQPKAVGGRMGYGFEASYQHYIQGDDFAEVTAGVYGVTAPRFLTTASYNFILAQPDWTSRGEWSIFAGPGLSIGYGRDISTVVVNYEGVGNIEKPVYANSFSIAAMGQAGIEYTFWFPLQLSVDLRPQLGVAIGDGVRFYRDGILGFVPCLSARYMF